MDLHEAVEAAWAEADQLRNDLAEKVQELEEANAVIDAVRSARGIMRQESSRLKRSALNSQPTAARLVAFDSCLALLDEVDGL